MRTYKWIWFGHILTCLLSLALALSFATVSLARQSGVELQSSLADYLNYLPIVMRQYFQGSIGILDPSFYGGGRVTTDFFNFDDNGNALAIQPDGKIVVSGSTDTGADRDFALARYNPDGSLDTSFDNDGRVTTDIFGGSDDIGHAIVLQPDGKIIVVGSSVTSTSYEFSMVRYNPNGSPETIFAIYGFMAYGYAVALQMDGKIVVAGSAYNGSNHDFALGRFNPDGSLDTSFDGDGKVTTNFGINDAGNAVVLLPDGKIVVAGQTGLTGTDFALARYNPNGSLDNTFDIDGKVTTDFGSVDVGYGAVVQADGKVVVAGYSTIDPWDVFALARYNPDGSLDSSFDGDGRVTTDFGGTDDRGHDVILQPDGKILVAGQTDSITDYNFALARFNPNGSLDISFDHDGRVITDINGNTDMGMAIALQPDGRIVMVGIARLGIYFDFALTRYK